MEPSSSKSLIHFDHISLKPDLYQIKSTCEVIADTKEHEKFFALISRSDFSPDYSSKITFIAVSAEKESSQKLSRVYFSEDGTLKLVFKNRFKDETKGENIGLIVVYRKGITNLVDEIIQRKPLSLMDKMWKKLGKSIVEHDSDARVIPLDKARATPPPKGPLTFSEVCSSVSKGGRCYQEDSHLIYQDEKMILLGVFDGHGDDKKISEYASINFEALFKEQLIQHPDDLPRVFKETMAELDKQIQEAKMEGGATAVVSYVDRQTGLIYTATVGDSESKIFRKVNGLYASLPLSRVSNWFSYSERQRFVTTSHCIAIAEMVMKNSSKENMRLGFNGMNLSRSLGDFDDMEGLITAKPEVTVAQLQPGDLILVASDGCWDGLTGAAVVKILSSTKNDSDVSRNLTEDIMKRIPKVADNITILGLRVED